MKTAPYRGIYRCFAFWRDDLVSFLIGCSFSFEAELLEAGIPVRHIEENCNVPMYNTNIACTPAGVFSGNMVVSMRPLPYNQVVRAVQVTSAMPRVHGAPIHIGDPLRHRYSRHYTAGLRRHGHYPSWRGSSVLALRRYASEYHYEQPSAFCDHPRPWPHVPDRCKKYFAEILEKEVFYYDVCH